MSIPGTLPTSERRVTTAAQAAARDRAAIAAGISSFDLMLQAGTACASLILRDYGDRLTHGVAVYAGTGNNGGDAWIVAAQLARAGVRVRMHAIGPPRTFDARRASGLFGSTARVSSDSSFADGRVLGEELLVVDGLVGTGHSGDLGSNVRAACDAMMTLRNRGATVIALDVPTGLDATSGEIVDGSVPAGCTICLGTIKRGTLLQRGHAGRVVLVDIGLGTHGDRPNGVDDDAWKWHDRAAVAMLVPPISWNAHKGQRGRVLITGGETGMAGAVALAAQAALLAGAGLVHACVDTGSVAAVQALCAEAIAHQWPTIASEAIGGISAEGPAGSAHMLSADDTAIDALAVGPGLGRSSRSASVFGQAIRKWRNKPMVLDADALWHLARVANSPASDAATALSNIAHDGVADVAPGAGRIVCTPHAGEFARLVGASLPCDWEERAALLEDFVRRAGVTVLLKGTPTLVASPGRGALTVVPHGTALLATGGSGDCLTGIITTLMAQGVNPHDAATVGATVHGLAAEMASARAGVVRGTGVCDMLSCIPAVWQSLLEAEPTAPYVMAALPAL